MRTINTVTGKITADEAGLILPHEHLFIDLTHEAVEPKTQEQKELFYGEITMDILGILRRNPYIVKTNLILDSIDDAVSEAAFVEKYGCNLIVDVTTVGIDRDFNKLAEFCKKSNVQVVAGTGLFVHDALPEGWADRSIEDIADWMVSEIENGDPETGIKPGVIGEIGVSEVIYPIERKSLIASAMASVRTGLPIYLHTYPWSRAGVEAAELLLENGVKPENICICHLDVTFNDEYIYDALRLGIYLEFDNLGKEFYFEAQDGAFSGGPFETDVARVRKIKEIIAKGYGNRLLLTNDLCLKASLHRYGGWGYDHVFANFVPMMRMEGISEEDISLIIKDNPKRFLFGE